MLHFSLKIVGTRCMPCRPCSVHAARSACLHTMVAPHAASLGPNFCRDYFGFALVCKRFRDLVRHGHRLESTGFDWSEQPEPGAASRRQVVCVYSTAGKQFVRNGRLAVEHAARVHVPGLCWRQTSCACARARAWCGQLCPAAAVHACPAPPSCSAHMPPSIFAVIPDRAEHFVDWLAGRVGRPCTSLYLRMMPVPHWGQISPSLRCVCA